MKGRDLADLVALAALWGASFLFMRVAAPAFGAVVLVEVRVVIAVVFLLPILLARGGAAALRTHGRRTALVGVVNSALPFVLFTYATLSLAAGFTAILNATTPMWTALVAALWLRERVRALQWLGLAIGAVGVTALVWDKIEFRPASTQWHNTLAIGAALLGSLSYGVAANLARRTLAGVPALVTATGSQIGAALVLLAPAVIFWPAQSPSAGIWAAAIALGVACTGIAYILYFRLIERVGAMRAAAVTFLVPLFATFWGSIFLAEPLTTQMIGGGAIVLLGTALSLGLVGAPRRAT